MKKCFVVLICVIVLSGCSFAPVYQRPVMNIPVAYKEDGTWRLAATGQVVFDNGPWWELYDDPILNELEAKVVPCNQNLKAALARYELARGMLAEQIAAYFPSVIGVFNAIRQQTSRNIANVLHVPLFNDFLLASNVTYEVDLWGRVRNSVATARSLAAASSADVAAIDLSLHAELANDYFALRGDDASQLILNKTVAMYEKALFLTRKRYQGGVIQMGDYELAQSQLNSAKTLAAEMLLQRAQLEHAIAVLIGLAPANFSLEPATPKMRLVTIVPEIPSVLLERRPDVVEAELKVQAANFAIGVARAAFFPAFNLAGSIAYESKTLHNLFNSSSSVWALGPTAASSILNNGNAPLLTQTIFDGGRLIALSQQAHARYFEAVANYRQTVLTAFQEVENNLVAIRRLDQENHTQTLAAITANRALNNAMKRYQGGLTTYLDVVVTQNIALQAKLTLIEIRERRQLASVQLIKALGGGYK